jgi:hypothetical protein
LDIPFDRTVQLNQLKKQSFPTQSLHEWWLDKDYLGTNDTILSKGTTSTFFDKIIQDIKI